MSFIINIVTNAFLSVITIALVIIAVITFIKIKRYKKVQAAKESKIAVEETDQKKLTYNTKKWTDVIDSIVWDHVINSVIEKRRLVGSGLFSEQEFSELCDFTGKVSCDYSGRFLWCKSHCVIERRGRSTGSKWFHDSPVDEIVVVYRPSEVNVKGYKDKKHVLEWHLTDCYSWDDFKARVTDPLHVLDNDPSFIGRRNDVEGKNNIAVCDSLNGPISVYTMDDEPL